jgi:hypothetical protein
MVEVFHKAIMLCHITCKAYQYYASNEHEARHVPKLRTSLCVYICVHIRPLRPAELTVDSFQSRWPFQQAGVIKLSL